MEDAAEDTKFYPAQDKVLCKVTTDDGTFFYANPGAFQMTKLAKTRSTARESVPDSKAYLALAQGKVDRGVNINTIDVPDVMRIKLKTGLEWFDADADNDNPGLTPSMVCLFTAGPGCGKSTLLRQMADACTKEGHIALYNAGEESIFQVKFTCERLNLDDGFIVACDPKIDTVLDHGRQLMKEQPGKQLFLFLDSLATLDDGFYKDGTINSMTAVRVMQKVVEFCKETFAVTIVIGHVNKAGKFAGKQQMMHDIDAHCHMSYVNKATSTKRRFKFLKNRFASIPVRGTVLDMTKGGLVVTDQNVEMEMEEEDTDDE